MAFRVLLVFLAMLLTTETERSKHLSTRDQFCLCGDRVVRIRVSSMDEKESFPISCDKRCRAETKREMKFRSLRRRREIDQNKNECHNMSRSPPRWKVSNVTVAFHERGNGSDWHAKVSWSPFTDFSEPWKGYCLFYTFKGDKNTIESVPDDVFLQKNQTSTNITSTFHQKRIFLKVIALPMSPNTNSTFQHIDYDEYQPADQERSTSTPSGIPSQYWTKSSTTMSNKCKGISKSSPLMIPSNVDVSFHEKGNGSGWYAKVSWSPVTDSSQPWTGYCLFYTFGEKTSEPESNEIFLQKDQTSINITSTLYKRQIFLNVIALPMSPNSSYPKFYLYAHRPTVTYQEIIPRWTKSFTTTKSPDTATYVSMSIGIIVGLALVVGFVVHFLRPKKDIIPPPLDFQYHAFIIYNNEDRHFMKNKLLPFLEDEHHLTCCIHYRDFVAGKPFRDCMAESVYKSHKVIALFSSNFVKSKYCKYELDLAIGRLVAHHDHSLIVIKIDKVDCEQLPTELQKNSFIDYSDLLERRLWKRKLLQFLGQSEDSQSRNVTVEQNSDNNNTHKLGENRARIGFNRLESTTSTDTVISTC